MKCQLFKLIFSVAVMMSISISKANSTEFALCKFNEETLSFKGNMSEQAKCLLRKVRKQGAGSTAQEIPSFLANKIGREINIRPSDFDSYLKDQGIKHSEVGGSPFDPISTALGKDKVRRNALYFVIHDTSSPEEPETSGFPSDMNKKSWSGNDLKSYHDRSFAKRVNAIVNRVGGSYTFIDFEKQRPKTATKLEMNRFASHAKGRFIHIENIQPRLKPNNKWAHIAPEPGFTTSQMKRLALLYTAASVRAKRWIIPAFHFNIDHNIASGLHAHDDPQNFNLNDWVNEFEKLVTEITE